MGKYDELNIEEHMNRAAKEITEYVLDLANKRFKQYGYTKEQWESMSPKEKIPIAFKINEDDYQNRKKINCKYLKDCYWCRLKSSSPAIGISTFVSCILIEEEKCLEQIKREEK